MRYWRKHSRFSEKSFVQTSFKKSTNSRRSTRLEQVCSSGRRQTYSKRYTQVNHRSPSLVASHFAVDILCFSGKYETQIANIHGYKDDDYTLWRLKEKQLKTLENLHTRKAKFIVNEACRN